MSDEKFPYELRSIEDERGWHVCCSVRGDCYICGPRFCDMQLEDALGNEEGE